MRLRMYLPPVHQQQQQQPILFLFIFACINTLQSFKNRRSIVDCFLDKKHALVWVVMFLSKHTFAKKRGKFKMSLEILPKKTKTQR